ncbi:hypothetical protein DE146DRAFT_782297 [Phaeosphaeria sp. MPI-PUGE-AT-0046c]|nr:hypothetical protein DE146DRAFT_782297 [Phaeosphaeria sp. MPI-PUGE-AT-0046c]
MRAFNTSLFALATLVAFVKADCCTPDQPFLSYCPDGSDSTPCCGRGSCNVFCCDCDDGCRTETYDGCVLEAAKHYGPGSGCETCYTSGYQTICITTDDCNNLYENAVVACKNKFGVSKRDAERPWTANMSHAEFSWTANMSHAVPAAGHEMFSLVDKDGNGNITFEEYIDYWHESKPELKEDSDLLTAWHKYFEKFDKNGDGVIDIDEHHRISDD